MTAGPVVKPLSQCGLCSRLPDTDYSFSKYGWPDHDVSMSPDSNRLIDVDKGKPGYDDRHHLLQCPECGTYYQYDYTYEYLVNGSEDEETITRLTPVRVRDRLEPGELELRMGFVTAELMSAIPNAKRYAVKCLLDYSVFKSDYGAVGELLVHPDAELREGAFYFLWKMSESGIGTGLESFLRDHISRIDQAGENDKIKNLIHLLNNELNRK